MAYCPLTLTITVRSRWWVRPYLNAVALFSDVFGLEPDYERIANTIINHGLIIKTQIGNT